MLSLLPRRFFARTSGCPGQLWALKRSQHTATLSKTQQLKELITSNELGFLMEAHNGLSARIVEEAGFKGIWGSGLSISASCGVRDNNELSWTQVLNVLEYMSDVTSIPILVDGDTGYGNFNNARRLVSKLESRGIAGVCIEDKLFPKTNSLLDSRQQPLADPREFALKIKAMKDVAKDPNFVVVARVESFVAGWSVEEALKRAAMYEESGADAIVVHSKKKDASEIEAFMKHWDSSRAPVIVIPTKYYTTPTNDLRQLGVRTVIWANHNMRAAITAMKNVTQQIYEHESLVPVEDKIATVQEVFRLQNDAELKAAEQLYLPAMKGDAV